MDLTIFASRKNNGYALCAGGARTFYPAIICMLSPPIGKTAGPQSFAAPEMKIKNKHHNDPKMELSSHIIIFFDVS